MTWPRLWQFGIGTCSTRHLYCLIMKRSWSYFVRINWFLWPFNDGDFCAAVSMFIRWKTLYVALLTAIINPKSTLCSSTSNCGWLADANACWNFVPCPTPSWLNSLHEKPYSKRLGNVESSVCRCATESKTSGPKGGHQALKVGLQFLSWKRGSP